MGRLVASTVAGKLDLAERPVQLLFGLREDAIALYSERLIRELLDLGSSRASHAIRSLGDSQQRTCRQPGRVPGSLPGRARRLGIFYRLSVLADLPLRIGWEGRSATCSALQRQDWPACHARVRRGQNARERSGNHSIRR